MKHPKSQNSCIPDKMGIIDETLSETLLYSPKNQGSEKSKNNNKLSQFIIDRKEQFISNKDLDLYYFDKAKGKIAFTGQVYEIGDNRNSKDGNISFIAITWRKKEIRQDTMDKTGLVLVRGYCSEELRCWDYADVIGNKKVINLKAVDNTFQICCITVNRVELLSKSELHLS